MATKKLTFVDRAMQDLNKSEKDLQKEKVEDFVAQAQIDAETQIGLLKTSELPGLQLKLKKANNSLDKAQKEYEKARFSLATDFKRYVENRQRAKDNVEEATEYVSTIEAEIKAKQYQLASFEEILVDLQ